MPYILCIDSATEVCSIALFDNQKLIAQQYSDTGYSHAQNITIFIQDVLNQAKIEIKNIDAVAVSKGPGSYTGLRIGVSTAKGICYATGKPLIAIDSLLSLAYNIKEKIADTASNYYIIPMIDARRMEVYCSVFNQNIDTIEKVNAHILDKYSFKKYFKNNKCYIGGTGAEKFKELHVANTDIINTLATNNATGMILPALEKYKAKDFEDIAYFEPYYLKDFIAGKPKKLV